MSALADNIRALKQKVPGSVKIVAVSKNRTVEEILEVYQSGHRIFGENKVQELLTKKEKLPADIEWHLVGHLQTNKVKYVVPFVSMIQSIDSMKLLSLVNREASGYGRIVPCLLQIHIGSEETKYGFRPDDLRQILDSGSLGDLNNIRICGVMGMATFTGDETVIRREFRFLADYFRDLKSNYFNANQYFTEISMGMSGDFGIAIEESSTLIRIGTLIFGERN